MENLQSSFNKPCSSPKDPLLSPTVAASCGSCNATTQAAKDIKMSLEEQLVLNLCNPELRGSALAELAKVPVVHSHPYLVESEPFDHQKNKREMFSDLALLLWHSFGTMAILIQEILAAYPTYLPLSASAASRACNALALLQTVASHPETRIPFLRAKIPMYFYSYLDVTNNGKGFEPLRLTSLSILGALVKVASEVFGVSRGGKQEAKDTWWWNDEVQRAIKEKKECFKRLHLDKSATNIEGYKIAKRAAKRAVSVAKGQAYDNLYQRLGTKEGEKDIYRMARIREQKTRDINQNQIRFVRRIQETEIEEALKRMKSGKAMGPDGIPIEGDNVEVEVINFLLRGEVIPLCLQIMEKGSEVSKVVATFIIQKILLDDAGLTFICATVDRFFNVTNVLATMVAALVKEPSTKILKYVVCCYLRLTYHPRALVALRINFPEALKDGTFNNCLGEDTEAVQWLQQLLDRLKDGGMEGATLPGADPPADGTAWGGAPPPVPGSFGAAVCPYVILTSTRREKPVTICC
ncbi:hypothetical protein PR202_gb12244 [Eleusine coracana subsp. coracana]|uniref:CCR4-NOT transcription complex subunit 11 n=1 Tax=Eleusine coracana subsp. coracana TaxID=191504 RepID=A0AAV5EPK3_ELECO|nr:hypothetical protein PR202_gb12244 [Eleusine coracana subsp. coracana]